MDDPGGQPEERQTHRCCAACATHVASKFTFSVRDDCLEVERLCCDVGDAAARSAARITVRIGRVTAENALVQAIKPPAETLEEGGYSIGLVGRARKIVRESAPRQPRRDLG